VFLRKLVKFTSWGHLLLVLTYLGLNAGFQFWDMEFDGDSPYSFFAKRAGWYADYISVTQKLTLHRLAVCNAALAFLLAMKNSPLSFLTGYSHERLNVLHRWVGRTIWFFSSLHVM
jgi:hypothetical protein